MDKLIEGLIPIAVSIVIGMVIRHPLTWRQELTKLQVSMLKEITRTDNWGSPLIWKQSQTPYKRSNHRP